MAKIELENQGDLKKTIQIGIERKYLQPFGGKIPLCLKSDIECVLTDFLLKKMKEFNTPLELKDVDGIELHNLCVVSCYVSILKRRSYFNLSFSANGDCVDMYSNEVGYFIEITQEKLDKMKCKYVGNFYEKYSLLDNKDPKL